MKVIDVNNLINDLSDADIDPETLTRVVSVINRQKKLNYPKEGHWIPAGSEGYECSECWGVSRNVTLCCPTCGSRNKLEEDIW